MRVNKYAMPVILIVAMFVVVLAAQATGSWQVVGSTQVVPLTTTGRPDPEAIKGKMTLEEIMTLCGIPQEALYSALKLSPDTPTSTQAKELEGKVQDFSIDVVRQVVKDYYATHP